MQSGTGDSFVTRLREGQEPGAVSRLVCRQLHDTLDRVADPSYARSNGFDRTQAA